ncbi:MAG: Hsp70 family protein [Myxococcaceae bacterium]|nr:Hsp70 family protein [Myxococcaceae bacterium]
MARHYLGIDLGTSNSTAVVFDGTQLQSVRDSRGSALTPSVVRIDAKGLVTVGSRARRFLDNDSSNTKAEFKRLMGAGDTFHFEASGKRLRPAELSAEVLKCLRTDVERQFGFAPNRAVISVPALFELPQSQATAEAARLAGFERIELIQEPVASALAAGWSQEEKGSWVVYDLGGGTFDCSLLETREGLLTVVGHDGDNFLGGRDFDWAIVDYLLSQLGAQHGIALKRGDPALAKVMPKLKAAIEDAKIELSVTDEVPVTLADTVQLGEKEIAIDMTLRRDDVEKVCLPLIDRTVAVVSRLLSQHGLMPSQVSRLVLVGGPTAMPVTKQRLTEKLGIAFAPGLDPMTLVAQGAALFAASSGVVAVSTDTARSGASAAHHFFMHFPAMTADLSPAILGRWLEGPGAAPVAVELRRIGGPTVRAEVSADEHAFSTHVELERRKSNRFTLHGFDAAGREIPVAPAEIDLVHGMTLADPPISRTLGVALADNRVRVYVERGAPLPTKRTFRHQTAETLVKGDGDARLKIPIVQGEYEKASLCRLVGVLSIEASELKDTLPVGSAIDVTIELDRGGRLQASALVERTKQLFERVDRLALPDANPQALTAFFERITRQLPEAQQGAVRLGSASAMAGLYDVEEALPRIRTDIAAAKNGDADAGQRAMRSLLEADAQLDSVAKLAEWPAMEAEAQQELSNAADWASDLGSDTEYQALKRLEVRTAQALESRNTLEVERCCKQLRVFSRNLYNRVPEVWAGWLEHLAARVHEASRPGEAQSHITAGRAAAAKRDIQGLKRACSALEDLLPIEAKKRRESHGSGIR